jgi:1,5-anhydro-D-fructose reductase (1,5-anhydro-D-mannitol-forming)
LKQVRWGIIGCGDVTELKSGPAFNKVPGFSLDMVMRRDAAKAEDYARRHEVPRWTSDADQLIHDPAIDAVYIATPPSSHRDYALKVAAAGKPAYVEKPMAMNLAECLEMAEAFEKAGLPLFVAYYRRSLPRFETVRAWIAEGRIGAPRHIHWGLSRPAYNDGRETSGANWRVDPAIAGAGYFADLACHGLDLFMHHLGDIAEATGIASNQQKLYAAEDSVAASWRFASGVTGSGFWNFGSRTSMDHVTLLGEKGRIEFSVFGNVPLKLVSAAGDETLEVAHPVNIQHAHIENIRRHLAGEAPFPALGREAAKVSAVMDKILGSYYG